VRKLLILSNLSLDTATTAFTTKPPNPTIVEEGKSITLEWTYTLDGTVVIAQFYIITRGGSILIGKAIGTGNISVEPDYQGRFSGQVTNTKAELTTVGMQRSELLTCRLVLTPTISGTLSHDVDIIVQYSSSITGLSGETAVIEGGNVTLECRAVGNPKPNITWTRLPDNSDVAMPLTNITEQDAGMCYSCPLTQSCTLPLTNISRHDAGMFRCTADNGVGRPATRDVLLVVQYPPEVNGIGQNATVSGGGEYTFSCPVDGNPVPSITWYSETGAYSGKQLKTGQSGCYICVARNIHGISDNITQCLIISKFNLPCCRSKCNAVEP